VKVERVEMKNVEIPESMQRAIAQEAANCDRYDKLARNFLAATLMIGTLYWIRL
jgi:hypothetical protein